MYICKAGNGSIWPVISDTKTSFQCHKLPNFEQLKVSSLETHDEIVKSRNRKKHKISRDEINQNSRSLEKTMKGTLQFDGFIINGDSRNLFHSSSRRLHSNSPLDFQMRGNPSLNKKFASSVEAKLKFYYPLHGC